MRIACADTAIHSPRGYRMMAISFYNALCDWTVSGSGQCRQTATPYRKWLVTPRRGTARDLRRLSPAGILARSHVSHLHWCPGRNVGRFGRSQRSATKPSRPRRLIVQLPRQPVTSPSYLLESGLATAKGGFLFNRKFRAFAALHG
jgi:hypothetical protein